MRYINSIIILGGVNILSVIGMAILTGYTGLFSLGHAAFMSIGAYAAAVSVVKLHLPFALSLLIGAVIAALSSLIIGYPTLRSKLKGDYFAIATLGFGEAVRLILNNTYAVIDGAKGMAGIPGLTTSWVVILVDIIGIILARNFVISQYGKNCVAIREQEVAAEMMGINVMKTKLWSVVISAFYAGISGALFAFYMTYLAPSMFSRTRSSDMLAGVVFGGMHSLTGPVIAAFVLTAMPEFLRVVSKWRLVIYGLLFVVVMLFRPQGLMGYKDISFEGIKAILKRRRVRRAAASEGGR